LGVQADRLLRRARSRGRSLASLADVARPGRAVLVELRRAGVDARELRGTLLRRGDGAARARDVAQRGDGADRVRDRSAADSRYRGAARYRRTTADGAVDGARQLGD